MDKNLANEFFKKHYHNRYIENKMGTIETFIIPMSGFISLDWNDGLKCIDKKNPALSKKYSYETRYDALKCINADFMNNNGDLYIVEKETIVKKLCKLSDVPNAIYFHGSSYAENDDNTSLIESLKDLVDMIALDYKLKQYKDISGLFLQDDGHIILYRKNGELVHMLAWVRFPERVTEDDLCFIQKYILENIDKIDEKFIENKYMGKIRIKK